MMEFSGVTRTTWLLAMPLLAVGLVAAANLLGGEKKIERRVSQIYALDDPRFMRELGMLLGPPFLGGNRARVLRNGDEFFPAML